MGSPSPISSAASVASPAANPSPSVEAPEDVPMVLGGDRNSEATGLGNSIHAVPSAPSAPSPALSPRPPSLFRDRVVTRPSLDGSDQLLVALRDTQEELDMDRDEYLAKAKEAIRRADELLKASGTVSSSAMRRSESVTDSLMSSLDDISTGNTIPLSPSLVCSLPPLERALPKHWVGEWSDVNARLDKAEFHIKELISMVTAQGEIMGAQVESIKVLEGS